MAPRLSRKAIGSLPPERAFVVQLEADAEVTGRRIGGRVEHVVSGRAMRFQNLRQLLVFLDTGFARVDRRSAAGKSHTRSTNPKREERE